MASTLLLDRDTWDLCLTANGDLALATEPYSQAQDVSSEARLFAGEAWYDTARGIDYFGEILGQSQPLQVFKNRLIAAALRVPGVQSATVYLSGVSGPQITGQIQFVTAAGVQAVAL